MLGMPGPMIVNEYVYSNLRWTRRRPSRINPISAALMLIHGAWRVQIRTGVFEAPVPGHLSYPDILGTAHFKGRVFHCAKWNHCREWPGKPVAVIGTGASAIHACAMRRRLRSGGPGRQTGRHPCQQYLGAAHHRDRHAGPAPACGSPCCVPQCIASRKAFVRPVASTGSKPIWTIWPPSLRCAADASVDQAAGGSRRQRLEVGPETLSMAQWRKGFCSPFRPCSCWMRPLNSHAVAGK